MKMKLSIVIAFALTGQFASCNKNPPTFTWLQDSFSPHGIPHLEVDFHDGQDADVVNLKKFNPFVRQAEEKGNIDGCIFTGYLRNESDVYVTLTGGCPFSKTFDITMRSQRTLSFMFQVREGSTKALPSVFETRGLIYDEAVQPPATNHTFKNPTPTNSLTLKVELNFDSAFHSKFGDDAYNAARRVATHAANMYQWASLNTKLTWAISNVWSIQEHYEANNEWLDWLGATYNNPDVNSNVYLSYNYDEFGVVGLAYIGTLCSATKYRTATTEYLLDDLTAAQIMAHEVGHNTGMDHDFNGSAGSPRYDSQGRICTNIHSIMDYNQAYYDKWSTCSNEDFANSDHSCL